MLLPLLALSLTSTQGLNEVHTSLKCHACHEFFSVLQSVVESDAFIDTGEDLVIALCSIFEGFDVCRGILNLYTDPFVSGFSGKFLDPTYMCSHMEACDYPSYHSGNLTAYNEEILKDMPPVKPWPEPSGDSYFVLQVTDMHVDFEYVEGSDTDCKLPLCCRSGSGNAGHWGSFSKCDVPAATVEAFLKQAAKLPIEFAVWTGDNPPHNIWAYEREKEMNITRRLASMFKEHLSVPVYPIIGNHDCFPMDMFNPDHEQILLGELSKQWAGWLDEDAIALFLQNGYYTTVDPATGLRIIGINNQLGDSFNPYLILNNTDPGNMLQWLRGTLHKAEQAGESVLILGHIPHGDHFAESTWSLHYRAIANRFQNIIVGQLFGHTHNDEFNVVRSLLPGQTAAGVLHVAPSFTTFSYHNPSFRLYEFDKQTHHLLNIHQYRLPLNSTTGEFLLQYDFKSHYGMTDLSPASFLHLLQEVKDNERIGQLFSNNFNSQYDYQAKTCDARCRESLYCLMYSDVYDENFDCETHHSATDRIFVFLELLQGKKWAYKE